MGLDPVLLSVLACPQDKGPLWWIEEDGVLYNPRLHRAYRVVDGIPVMLADEAISVDDAGHDRMMSIIERDGVKPTFDA